MKVESIEYNPFNAGGPYPYAVINYNGHWGFACDWGDCLEEIHFIDGYRIVENYIEFNDINLKSFRHIMVENES